MMMHPSFDKSMHLPLLNACCFSICSCACDARGTSVHSKWNAVHRDGTAGGQRLCFDCVLED
jgi:hypothetical protein